MIEYSIGKDVTVEPPKPNKLSKDVMVPQSLAMIRKIQLDCLKAIKKVRIK